MQSFVYEVKVDMAASCRQAGQRRFRDAVFEEVVPLRLGIAEQQEAPLGLRLSFRGFDKPIDVRSHAGRLWVPFGADEWIRKHYDCYPGSGENFVENEAPLEETLKASLKARDRYWRTERRITAVTQHEYRDVFVAPDVREKALETLYQSAGDFLAVEDHAGTPRLWVPIPEPCWMIHHFGSFRGSPPSMEIRLCLSNNHRIHSQTIHDVFNIQDLEKAQWIARLFSQNFKENVDCEIIGSVEIFNPNCVNTCYAGRATAVAAARALRHAVGSDDFCLLSPEEFAHWAEFRDTIRDNCAIMDREFGGTHSSFIDEIAKSEVSEEQAERLAKAIINFAPHFSSIVANRQQRENARYGREIFRRDNDLWTALGLSAARERLIVEGLITPSEAYQMGDVPEFYAETGLIPGQGGYTPSV